MSEALGYSTLLVSTADYIQLPLACPNMHQQGNRYSGGCDVKVRCAFEKKKNSYFLFFLYKLNR